ncbi:MAG TPA: hypothetical protein VN368_00650, partial [Candidatus Methylomirabilis sp.]|nr:hypothetical protein [Candidatus Methylomirabilis sp.]
NGIWANGTTVPYNNSTVPPHGWSNITVFAYNISSTGSLSTGSISENMQLMNNAPLQLPIGNKTIMAGDLLSFNVSATDADNDPITYSTNSTNGMLNSTTGEYSWPTKNKDAGTYIWQFNSSDPYGGVVSEVIIITVNIR